MKQENINNKVLNDLDNRIDNWNKLEGVPERVDTIETDATALELRVGENETDISGLETNKQETQVKVAKVEKELNSLKSININSNQEATQVAQGYGVVNLPKTAGDGHADFGIKGLTATNLVVNGDFRNGTSGWGSVQQFTVDTEKFGFPTIKTTNNNQTSNAIQDIPGLTTDHFYVRAMLYIDSYTSGTLRFIVRDYASQNNATGTILDTNKLKQWQLLSVVVKDKINGIRVNISDYTTVSTHYYANTMAINLTQTFGAGNEPTKEQCDIIFSDYFEGTQSTQGAMRVKSIGKNLYTVEQSLQADKNRERVSVVEKDGRRCLRLNVSTSILPIKFEPNTQYTISVSTRKETLNSPSGIFTMRYTDGVIGYALTPPSTTFTTITYTSLVGKSIQNIQHSYGNSGNPCYFDLDTFEIKKGTTPTPYEPYKESLSYLNAKQPLRSLPNGVADEITSNGMLIKRVSDLGVALATPITTPIQTSGSLIAYPSGTVTIEQVVADAGLYTTKMDILNTDLPIKTLDKLYKVDYTTGLEHSLDVSKAVVTAQSFTHPDLTMGDIVFFEYYYDLESTNGNASVKYYDSRYTVKDSVTNKVYKWSIAIANGIPTIKTVEV